MTDYYSPLSDSPLSDSPLSDSPLSDRPLSDSPLSDRPLSDSPLSDRPLPKVFAAAFLNQDHFFKSHIFVDTPWYTIIFN